MPGGRRIEFDDVEGHRWRMGRDQGPQAVTVQAPDGEEYPATLTMDDIEGHRRGRLDFRADDVEGHGFKVGRLDQGPQAVTIRVGSEEITGTLMADNDDVEGHHVRKPIDFPNSNIP
jgi:hypothetical protein